MKNRSLASRYARALASTLATEEEFEKTAVELQALADLFEGEARLSAVFENPAISAARRKPILDEIVRTAALSPKIARFLDLIAGNDRISLLSECASVFSRLRDEKLGIVEAELTTAVPVDESIDRDWTRALAALTGKKIRLTKKVKPSIIGGAVARIGSVVYDGSLKSRLTALRERLVGGS